jgi:hypothetical protein
MVECSHLLVRAQLSGALTPSCGRGYQYGAVVNGGILSATPLSRLQAFKPLNTHLSGLYSYTAAVAKEGGGKNLRKHALTLFAKSVEWHVCTGAIAGLAKFKSMDAVGVASVDYLMYAGYIQMGLHWLKMEAAVRLSLLVAPPPSAVTYRLNQVASTVASRSSIRLSLLDPPLAARSACHLP